MAKRTKTMRYKNRFTGAMATKTGEFVGMDWVLVRYVKDEPTILEQTNSSGKVIATSKVSEFVKPKRVFERAYVGV